MLYQIINLLLIIIINLLSSLLLLYMNYNQDFFLELGGTMGLHYTNMPWQCGYPDRMSHLGRMVLPRAPPSGKPSSFWEIFYQDTHTGMAYLFYYTKQTPIS